MATNKDNCGAVLYEIRKNGVSYLESHIPLCGYSPKTIKDMQVAGFDLYADGKKVKKGKVNG